MTSLLPLALALALGAGAGTARRVVDRVAATVDGDVVTLSDLQDRAGPEWLRIERMEPGKERDEARTSLLRRVLDAVVAERLLAHEAEALGIEVSAAQIDAAVQDIKTRNRFDDAQLAAALEEQGIDLAAFKDQVRRELQTYQVLQAKVRNRVKLSEADVKNYYQTHPQEFGGELELRVRHIFLPVPAEASRADEERARAEGEKVLARLKAGEDFAKVAREVSKGPSAPEGGDLGWLRRGTVQKQLDDAAFALQDGQTSGLVRAGPGFHVLKVEERRVGGGRTFEEAQEEIRMRLYEEQVGTFRQQYIDELKRQAHVEVKLPELKS